VFSMNFCPPKPGLTLINKLEEWRGNIKARQESVRGVAQLVSAYGTVA
jgi:hypothetical protein